MRELNNAEKDPVALEALGKELVDFSTKTKYLLIPSTEQLTEAVLLLRRLVLISQKVLAVKSYFNVLRDLQRMVITASILAQAEVAKMPASTDAERQAQREMAAQLEAAYQQQLANHPPGDLEGEKIAAQVRHRLCTEDVFCAACAFLQLEVSRRGSIYYIRGESPEFLETKRNRDPLSIDNEITLKTLSANLARPDAERGKVEQDQITYGYNLLAKRYALFVMMPGVMQWIKDGESLSDPRRKVDVRREFQLSLRDYDTVMLMARQMGLAALRPRKTAEEARYTLNVKNHDRVLLEAKRRGYTPHRMLNALLRDFFMLIDKRERTRAAAEAAAEAAAGAAAGTHQCAEMEDDEHADQPG